MTQEIFLSVIIPTYKRPEGLRMLLNSIEKQNVDLKKVEVVVINNSDSSRSDNENVCKLFKKSELQVFLLDQPLQGSSYAKNLGIEHSKGRWLLFLDDDEEISPNYFEFVFPLLLNAGSNDLFGGPCFPLFDSGLPEWLKKDYFTVNFGDKARILSSNEFLIGGNLIVSKELANRMGGYLTEFGHRGSQAGYGEDTEYVARAIKQGGVQHYIPVIGINHHIPGDHLRLEWFKKQKKLSAQAKARFYLLSNPLPINWLTWQQMRMYFLRIAAIHYLKMSMLMLAEPFRNRSVFKFHENYWIERVSPAFVRYQINRTLFLLMDTYRKM